MACGCPVIVSNAASLPEVCGDAASYCAPHSVEDIAEKIKEMVTNEALREELCQKGLERAKHFTWGKCARETISIIEKVMYS
jgi:glycosyltransferase involved in cell wall biosynthesis